MLKCKLCGKVTLVLVIVALMALHFRFIDVFEPLASQRL